jgi:hypothetical protein
MTFILIFATITFLVATGFGLIAGMHHERDRRKRNLQRRQARQQYLRLAEKQPTEPELLVDTAIIDELFNERKT